MVAGDENPMIDQALSKDKEPTYRKVHRLFIAFCIATSPLTMAGWFALCPQSSDPACPNVTNPLAAVAAFQEASALRTQWFLTCSVIAPYICPISYLGLGMLAMRKAPWTSTIGIACGWVGSVPWGFIADSMFYFTAAARLGQNAAFARLHSWQGLFAFPQMVAVAGGWVIGHLLGYALLGIALFRARVIPRWASGLIVAAAPLMGPIAYGTNIGLVQVLGYLCVFAGSVPAAFITIGWSEGMARGVNA
jgi:hypothetical protein